MKKTIQRIIFILTLVFLVSCSNQASTILESDDSSKEESITDAQVEEPVNYPIALSNEEKNSWIKKYSGEYVCEENLDIEKGEGLGITVSITPNDDNNEHNIYQITCCVNDGVVYDVDHITQEDEITYSIHLNRVDINDGLMQNITIFPTDTYLVQIDPENNDVLKLQFVGVYKDTISNFDGEIERGEWLKYFSRFYKNEGEWYTFIRKRYYVNLDECKQIIDECFTHYYQRSTEGILSEDKPSFLLWQPVFNDGSGEYVTNVHFIQYKSDINKVYHSHDVIWDDGQAIGNKTQFSRGYPEMLEIMQGPIRIRTDHNTDSEIVGSAEVGSTYLYFDEYEDADYVWYKIYLEKSDSYAWIAGSKKELWIGKLA